MLLKELSGGDRKQNVMSGPRGDPWSIGEADGRMRSPGRPRVLSLRRARRQELQPGEPITTAEWEFDPSYEYQSEYRIRVADEIVIEFFSDPDPA